MTLNESYLNNLDAGEHTLETTYDYGVEGGATEVSTNFKVTPTSITRATVSSISPMVRTGQALTPKPVLTLNGVTLKEGVDYDLAYKDNVNGGQATVTITGKGNFVDSTQVQFTITEPSLVLSGKGHVQDKGDVTAEGDETGITIGSTGESKRLEAFSLDLPNQSPYEGSIEYCAHVQDVGWQKYVKDGNAAGTTSQAKRIEAVRIKLTGEIAKHYDVWYRVHAENYGWLGWAKNGERSGSEGKALRMEAMEIVLVAEGAPAPGPTENAFVS